MAESQKPPERGKRLFKLAGMTASIAGGYARDRVRRAFLSQEAAAALQSESMRKAGERIAGTLGELKGAAMKLGQMASMAADLLPPEMQDALSALQGDAPPMDFSVIEETIEREFDQPVHMLFDEFEEKPFAAASIGQVHRARVDGQEVIVKVQYPGVDKAVDSDMRHLKYALLASGLVNVDKKALDASFKEVSDRMHEELDYCNESDNVRRFHAYHKERHPFVVVPEVLGHRSSKRVLTMTDVRGDHVRDMDARGYTQEQRDLCGRNLWTAMESQIFDGLCIHADPNAANFAFRKDGTVVMYDFGCIKQLAPEVPEGYRSLMVDGLLEDWPKIEQTLNTLAVRRPGTPPPDVSFYKMWRDWLAVPVLEANPLDFGTASFEREMVTKLAPAVIKNMGSFQPSKELVFLNRMFVGHYANLRKMRARVPVGPMLRERFPETATWFSAA